MPRRCAIMTAGVALRRACPTVSAVSSRPRALLCLAGCALWGETLNVGCPVAGADLLLWLARWLGARRAGLCAAIDRAREAGRGCSARGRAARGWVFRHNSPAATSSIKRAGVVDGRRAPQTSDERAALLAGSRRGKSSGRRPPSTWPAGRAGLLVILVAARYQARHSRATF